MGAGATAGVAARAREPARRIAVPADARALSTVARVDYEDAFVVRVPRVEERTGEEWARAFLEDTPESTRRRLLRGWRLLGMRLDPAAPDRVLGWEVRRSEPDFALLATRSWLGLEGEVLLQRRRGALLFATFLTLRGPLARVVWVGVAPRHREAVTRLLQRVARRHP